MVQFFAINGLINAIAALFLAVYLSVRCRGQNICFTTMLLSLAMCIWSLGYWLWLSSSNFYDALFFSRILSIGSTLIPIFLVHWVIIFLKKEYSQRIFLKLGYVITFIFLLFGFSRYFIAGVEQVGVFPFWPQAGFLYTLYISISYIGFLGYGLFLLGKHYLKENGLMRMRYRVIFYGLIVSAVGGFTNFPAWYGVPIPPFGNVLTTFFFIVCAYAIMNYRVHESYMRIFGRV
jgi:hypothetical protein